MNGAGGRMLLVLLAAGPGTLPAERAAADPAALEQAARLYDAGDAAGAAEIWERLLRDEDADLDRAALHYNLGNAAFRNGRLGQAMLEWERSFALRPRDGDVLRNLALAREILDERLAAAAASGEGDAFALELRSAMSGVGAALRRTSPERFAAWLVAAALTAGGLVTMLLLRLGRRRLVISGLVVTLLAASASGTLLAVRLGAPPLAVVVEPGAALRSGPAATFPQLAALPEGLYLELSPRGEATGPGFHRVVAAGIAGYAESDAVAPIRE